MKSKYSSNRGDYLYRAYALKSKKKKKAFGNLPKVIVTVFFFVLAGFLFVFGGGYFLSHSPLFSVKKVAVSVANEKTIPDNSMFSSFAGKNLNKIKNEEISKIFDNKNSEYGVRAVKKILPSTLKIVLYRRQPMFLVNSSRIINNDLTVYTATEKCVNYLSVFTPEENIASIFDISGLPTIYKQLMKHRDDIKYVEFSGSNIFVKLKKGKTVIISPGQSLPDLKKAEESEYRVLDFRFKNAIYVKK